MDTRNHEAVQAGAEHVKPSAPAEVCWLLDLRRYGIATANYLHDEHESSN